MSNELLLKLKRRRGKQDGGRLQEFVMYACFSVQSLSLTSNLVMLVLDKGNV